MPLSAQEKNAIAQGTIAAVTADIAALAALSAPATLGLSLLLIPISAVVAATILKPRFPRFNVGALAEEIRGLQRRGLDPLVTTDPFSGSAVVSTRGQEPFLTDILRAQGIRKLAAETDFSSILQQRQGVIQGLARTAEQRGFRTAIDPALRGGVFRPTAESPLQFIEGSFLQ